MTLIVWLWKSDVISRHLQNVHEHKTGKKYKRHDLLSKIANFIHSVGFVILFCLFSSLDLLF